MRNYVVFSIAVAMFCVAGSTAAPRHLLDAQMLVENISQRYNVYEHKDCFIKWQGVAGATRYENRTDCSDFLALLVEHSYHVTPEQLRAWTGHTRPQADHWHDAITARRGFEQIAKLVDAKAGDVLAVRFPPGMADTGHIMLMCGPAQSATAKPPLIPDTRQWTVTVIDSTKSPHGPTDTRQLADGTTGQGVGRGVIRIYTNPAGDIAGYSWSDGGKSKFDPESQRNMVIGRLNVATHVAR